MAEAQGGRSRNSERALYPEYTRMAKAAAKGMIHVLAIIAVIIIIGGLAFMAYRQREGASGSNSCVDACTSWCKHHELIKEFHLEGGGRRLCTTCCSQNDNNHESLAFKKCMKKV